MEKATALMPPSIGLNGVLLSVETQYSQKTRNENTRTLDQCMG